MLYQHQPKKFKIWKCECRQSLCIKHWSLIQWLVYPEPNWVQFSSSSPKPSFPTAQKMLGWWTKLLLSDVLCHTVPPSHLQFIHNQTQYKKTASYSSTHVLTPNFNFSINTIYLLWLPFFFTGNMNYQILQCYKHSTRNCL